ncbi:MAG TPA: glycosyltransferase [bacterium]|nr:glycosyltransferase [bacterium]
MSAGTRRRVAYLVSHPIQYQVPLLQRLAAHPEILLHVYYMDDQGVDRRQDQFGMPVQWDIPMREGYAWTLLRNRSPLHAADTALRFVHPEILGVLRRERYDALLVHGYAHLTEWLAFWGARRTRTPILLRGESTLLGRRSPALAAVKRFTVGSLLLPRIHAALAIGTLNREFYLAYGVPADRIFWVPYAVDNDRFRGEAERWQPSRAALRAELGLPPELPVLLYAGKLIPRKRPFDVLEACARIAADHPAAVVMLGEGVERSRLQAAAARYGLPHVVITGFVNQSEIGRYYAVADVLVLPSEHEPWGLVLNEGMCFGLPVVASDAVGAVPDLVHDEDNGFVYPMGDVPALADALRRLLADPALRARMGARSREIVAGFSYDADVSGILEALRRVAARPRLGIAS